MNLKIEFFFDHISLLAMTINVQYLLRFITVNFPTKFLIE